MDAVQRQEFEAHLKGCAQCQEIVGALCAAMTQRQPVLVMPIPPETEHTKTGSSTRRALLIVIAALVTVIVGFALGWSVWQMAHH
jgi:hypothetical protein